MGKVSTLHLYRRCLRALQKWPEVPSRVGRDYVVALKNNLKESFRHPIAPRRAKALLADLELEVKAVEDLTNDKYLKKYNRSSELQRDIAPEVYNDLLASTPPKKIPLITRFLRKLFGAPPEGW